MRKEENFKGKSKATQFTSENQPENRGRKANTISKYLKEIGDAKKISFTIRITNQDGTKVVKKGSISNRASLNELLAILLWADAINGSDKARKEILDRIEGKPTQTNVIQQEQPLFAVFDARKNPDKKTENGTD